MQNKEFDKLVESFLTPKTKLEENNAFSLASLLSLVEEVENTDKVINEIIGTPILPTVGATQKKYEPEPKEVTQFFQIFQQVLTGVVQTGTVEERLQKLIEKVNELKSTTQKNQLKVGNKTLSETFATILFVGSLNNMIGNIVPDLPSVAGTLYEKFISFMVQGKAMGELKLIYDVQKENEFISLKLVKQFKNYTGSINTMGMFFTDQKDAILDKNMLPPSTDKQSEKFLTLIIAEKQSLEAGQLKYYSYQFNFLQFLDMLGEENLKLYNAPIVLKNDIKSMEDELKQITAELATAQGKGDNPQELINNQKDLLTLLNDKKQQLKQIKYITQFNIDKTKLDSLSTKKIMQGDDKKDVLSLSPQDKDRIINVNEDLFKSEIKEIIDQSNAVYYKVNNFLLSDPTQVKTNAIDAYKSVSSLEQNLQKYT